MAANFSASDIAFEGFRLARERPRSILVWAGLLLIFNLVGSLLTVGLAGEAMTTLARVSADEAADPDAAMAAAAAVAPLYALLTPLSLAFYAVLYAAAYRAVLRPAEAPQAGDLRFGMDEVRQALALVAVGLIFLVVLFVVMLLAGILAALGAALAGAAGALVGTLAVVAATAVSVWLLVKLSLVGPYTFDRRSLDLRAAWGLTRGASLQLLGAYLLAVALMVVVFLLGLLVFMPFALIAGGGLDAMQTLMQPDLTSVGGYFTPVMLAYLVISSLLGALTFAILVGATAAAYRALSAGRV